MYAVGGWQEELSKKGAIFSLGVNFLWERQKLSRNKNRRRMIKKFTNELLEMPKKKKMSGCAYGISNCIFNIRDYLFILLNTE